MFDSIFQILNSAMDLERNFDEKHFVTWLNDNIYILWITCVLYTIGVFVLHRWMKNKPPIEFNPSVLPTWNVLFGILNLVIFLKVAPGRIVVIRNFGWTNSICDFDHYSGPEAFWSCVYFLSKLLWLVDIAFFILKKKTLSPFRLWHHISLLVWGTLMLANRQVMIVWGAVVNSFTTCIFYGVPFFISTNKSATRKAMLFMIFVSLLEVRISKENTQWRIQDFSGGANPTGCSANIIIWQNICR